MSCSFYFPQLVHICILMIFERSILITYPHHKGKSELTRIPDLEGLSRPTLGIFPGAAAARRVEF